MKAYVLHGINDLQLEDVEVPKLEPSQVLVKVKAAGICGSDIPRIYKTGAHKHPLIPGHEFCGQVVKTGSEADKAWNKKRVGIFPLIPCGQCKPCSNGQFEMCRNYNYLGSRCNGGFAEYVAVPQKNLIELPENVTYEQGAMLEPMAVAVHAMRRVTLNEGDYVVVCGLGTIGLMLTMFLIEKGIKNILVIGNKDFQKSQIENMGIDSKSFCDSRSVDVGKWILEATDGNGADAFFECVGKNETFSWAVGYTAPAGKVILVGNPASDMNLDKNTYWKVLRNQLKLYGTWNSSFTNEEDDDWHYVIERLRGNKIHPEKFISHSFALEDLKTGMHIMRDKKEDYIKVMGIACN